MIGDVQNHVQHNHLQVALHSCTYLDSFGQVAEVASHDAITPFVLWCLLVGLPLDDFVGSIYSWEAKDTFLRFRASAITDLCREGVTSQNQQVIISMLCNTSSLDLTQQAEDLTCQAVPYTFIHNGSSETVEALRTLDVLHSWRWAERKHHTQASSSWAFTSKGMEQM